MCSNNIRVVVRIRPENEVESAENHRLVVRPMDERVLVFDPKEEAPAHFFHGKVVWKRDITKRKNRDLKFAFDHVFAPHVKNQLVFDETANSVLDGVLNGYNCSVFAYGATGAGKTHTMLGKPSDPGVMFLTVMELYRRIEAMKSEKNVEVAVSYLEVYNEQIRDLLLPNGTLPIREDSERGVVVRGLSLHKPRSAEELMHMLGVGNNNRTQHPTDANSESSRSHAVFQVFVRQTDRTAGLTADVKMAKLSMIDLAGSERATMTRNMGMRFREGANINRSLLALGNVINALAETKGKSQHVPYRNSKLTRLLKDSLGGNCQTVMIAAVSPSSLSYEDTYNTLKYADRAKHIKAELKENVLSVDMHVSRYAQIVEELRKEIVELKAKLNVSANNSCLQQVALLCPKTKSFQDQLNEVFMSRISVRKELLEFESSERDIQWKILCKTRKLTRLALIANNDDSNSSMSEKIQRSVEAWRRRLSSLASRKESAMSRLQENSKMLTGLETEISAQGSDQVPQVLEQCLRRHHLEVEVSDYRRYNKYLRQTVRYQEREMQNNDRLIGSLLQMVRKQYFLLKGHGIATSDVTKDFTGLQQLIDGRQEVRWADQSPTPTVSVDSNDPQNLLTFSLLASYNTPPTPRSICRSESSYSPSPRCVNSHGVTQSISSPAVSETQPLSQDAMSRIRVEETDPLGIPPPVTQYAGRTPSAKHFLVTHSQKSGISETEVKGTNNHELDVTYVCKGPSLGVDDCSVKPQHPTSSQDTVAAANRTALNTGTVIKSWPTLVSQALETVTKSASTLTSQTAVTKQKPVHIVSETVTKSSRLPSETHPTVPHAARAMKFDNTPPTPKSDMSFADAVKSPGRMPLRSITDNCMSPLALPLNSPKPEPKQRIAFSGIENAAAQPEPSSTAPAPALRRTGFPSLFSQTPDPKLQARRVLPRYMQTTKAVTNRAGRTTSYSRLPMSRGSDENQKPGRCARVDSSRTKTLDRFRSKSVPSLRG